LGFSIESKRGYMSALKKNAGGRMHAAFIQSGDGIYCDLHYDYRIHFLLFGVDYKQRPGEFFEDSFRQALKQKGIAFKARKVNWFTRKNKAVFRGFRL
ncbi:hypothetical protein MJD09_26825, partial [bacterium]|nr:hypothetical protein [bacterium]